MVDGGVQIDAAVRLLKIGGHTPGCMAVMAETAIGTVCLTSDVMSLTMSAATSAAQARQR
jgi:hypothetical protein